MTKETPGGRVHTRQLLLSLLPAEPGKEYIRPGTSLGRFHISNMGQYFPAKAVIVSSHEPPTAVPSVAYIVYPGGHAFFTGYEKSG